MPYIVFSDEYRNWCTVDAVEINKKYLGIGYRYLCSISISSNMQPQLYKLLQCKLKCNML